MIKDDKVLAKKVQELMVHLYWSNHLVALVSAACLIPSFILLGTKLSWEVLILVYCSSFIIYSLDRNGGLSPEDLENNKGRQEWLSSYSKRSKLTLLAYTVIVGYLFLDLNLLSQVLLVVLTVPTIAYVFPLIRYKGRWCRSKEFVWGKSFNITAVWASLAVFLPASFVGEANLNLFVLFAFNFSLTFASCQFFDLRDFKGDKLSRVKSLVVVKGEAYCRNLIIKICLQAILAAFVLCLYEPFFFICFSPLALFYLLLLKKKTLSEQDYIWIDLVLAFPALMSLFFYAS